MKIDIFSGFLGAGKTTLIRKLLKEAYTKEKVVLIENEFGEIGIDGGFLKDTGIEITEMNSGCICCSLVGDFAAALKEVVEKFSPDRIIIEPSGVGKLSDVAKAVEKGLDGVKINSMTTVINAGKAKMYSKNFGEFFNDQLKNANCVVLSHVDSTPEKKVLECVEFVKAENPNAVIISTPISDLTGEYILSAMENKTQGAIDMIEELIASYKASKHHDEEEHHHHHHHDEDDDDDECCCHHHHDDDDDDDDNECCHHHHHHDDDDDDDECCCHHHHDEDDDDDECCCHHHHDDDDDNDECCHHHHHDDEGEHHHHHHDADEVFASFGKETARKYTKEELSEILSKLADEETYGLILRAKGSVQGQDGKWINFDYIPEYQDVRDGSADIIGKICVIGSKINSEALAELFKL